MGWYIGALVGVVIGFVFTLLVADAFKLGAKERYEVQIQPEDRENGEGRDANVPRN